MNEIVEISQHFDHWVFQPHSSLLRQAPAGPCWPVKTERWLKFLQRALSFQPAPVTYATIQNPQNSDIHSCSTGISKCLLLHYPRNWKLSSQAVAACWVVLELKVKILYPGPLLEPGSPAICAGVVPTELSRTSTDLWENFHLIVIPSSVRTENMCPCPNWGNEFRNSGVTIFNVTTT